MLLKRLSRRRHKWVWLDLKALNWVWEVRPEALKLSEYLWVGQDGQYYRCDGCGFYRRLKDVRRPLLAQIGWGQVDGYPLEGEVGAGVAYGGAHTLLRWP